MRRGSVGARAVNDAFERLGIPAEQARRQVMLFLDNTLFCHDRDPYRLLGLTPACSVSDIRRRHKQMLQVFHPDRHADGQGWFTDRSEQLNRAYAYLKTNHGKPGATSIPNRATVTASSAPAPAAAKPRRTRRQPGPRFPDKDDLRRRLTSWLGKPSNLQQRVYMVLVTVPGVLLLMLYLSSPGPVDRPATSAAATGTAQNAISIAAMPVNETQVPADPAPDVTADTGEHAAAPRVLRVTYPDASARPTEPETETGRSVIPLRVTHPDAGAAAERMAFAVRAPDPESPAAKTDDNPRDLAPARANPHGAATVAQAEPGAGDEPATANAIQTGEPDPVSADDDAKRRDETEPQLAAATESPTTIESSATEPSATEPSATEPSATEPSATESSATESSATESSATEPAATEPTAAEPTEPEPRTKTQAAWSRPSDSRTKAEGAVANRVPDTVSVAPVGASVHTMPASSPAQRGSPPEPETQDPNIHALLEAYETAYNRSDIDRFSGLFRDGARTKNAASKKEITRKYSELFQRTQTRNLVLDDVSIRAIGERQYEVSTRFAVEWTYPDGKTGSSSGRFNMHLVKVDGELKIWRLDY